MSDEQGGVSTRSQCLYNKGIGPSDLTSCSSLKDSQGANFSYSRVSVKLSPPCLPETMPECARAPAPAELPRSSPDSTLIVGGREPDAGQMVEVDPGSGHLRGRAKTKDGGQMGVHVGVEELDGGTQTGTYASRAREIHRCPCNICPTKAFLPSHSHITKISVGVNHG